MHQLEDPLAFATTTMTPLKLPSTIAVPDVIGQDRARQDSSGPVTDSGLGILKFLKGKNLLVTGATGFLAKGTNDLTDSLFSSSFRTQRVPTIMLSFGLVTFRSSRPIIFDHYHT